MQTTEIAWCSMSWNPVRGCSRVSPGCENCYAEAIAARFSDPGLWGHGVAKRTPSGPRWTREVRLLPEKLSEPLPLRKPQRIFVNSTSDLFHESLTFEKIAAVVGVMAACPQHIFMTLTKRAKRQRQWFEWVSRPSDFGDYGAVDRVLDAAETAFLDAGMIGKRDRIADLDAPWPLPNWQVGVSAEDQQRWDERKEHLRSCPAAVRFVSAEPLLDGIDFSAGFGLEGIDQVIVGGESGPGARPCRVEWIRDILRQCKAAGVAGYCKQLGAKPTRAEEGFEVGYNLMDPGRWPLRLKDKKGGDPSEWPEDLRVREQV